MITFRLKNYTLRRTPRSGNTRLYKKLSDPWRVSLATTAHACMAAPGSALSKRRTQRHSDSGSECGRRFRTRTKFCKSPQGGNKAGHCPRLPAARPCQAVAAKRTSTVGGLMLRAWSVPSPLTRVLPASKERPARTTRQPGRSARPPASEEPKGRQKADRFRSRLTASCRPLARLRHSARPAKAALPAHARPESRATGQRACARLRIPENPDPTGFHAFAPRC